MIGDSLKWNPKRGPQHLRVPAEAEAATGKREEGARRRVMVSGLRPAVCAPGSAHHPERAPAARSSDAGAGKRLAVVTAAAVVPRRNRGQAVVGYPELLLMFLCRYRCKVRALFQPPHDRVTDEPLAERQRLARAPGVHQVS